MAVTVVVLGSVAGLGTVGFQYLLRQMKNPMGIVGNALFSIWNNVFQNMTEWGLEEVEVGGSDSVLDIGIGGGQTVFSLAEKYPNLTVHGVDISEDSVKFSSEKNKECIAAGRVFLQQSDVAQLPYEAETFHLVTAFQTHMYWDELETGLEQIYRVLKPKGKTLLATEKDKIEYHMVSYKETEEFVKLLEKVGFTEVHYKETEKWISFTGVKEV